MSAGRIDLRAHPTVLANLNRGALQLARAIQAASKGKVGVTFKEILLGDITEERLTAEGIPLEVVQRVLSGIVEHPLRPGNHPLENLIASEATGLSPEQSLEALYRKHLPFVVADVVPKIESGQLRVFMLGGGGSGVVSAVQDMVNAFCSAGYFGRAFPLFDPSKKGAPVMGYGIVSREPIMSHAPFEVPDIVLLFDPKLFPRLRAYLAQLNLTKPEELVILVNTPMDPAAFRAAADFHDPCRIYTLDAAGILRGKRIPPNYAMMGGMLGILGEAAVDSAAFIDVVRTSLTEKFGTGKIVEANVGALRDSLGRVQSGTEEAYTRGLSALGRASELNLPNGQSMLCEDGNRAVARALGLALNLFPAVIPIYPCTPQTQIAEYLAQAAADGKLSAEIVAPESEHGVGCAIMGAARDQVLVATALSGPGTALFCETAHAIAGMRMGSVVVSNVLRSLNSPLDVENDHGDLYKVLLDAGFVTLMSRDVQQAFDFHLMSYLIGMYAEYRERGNGVLEMIPDRSVMLPVVVASEGFEVSHAPERYLAVTPELAKALYDDPFFQYLKTFVRPGQIVGTNESVMGALQLSNARMETDYQRHKAMELAYEVLKKVFEIYGKYTGRVYDFIHAFNLEEAEVVFVVAGAANGTFEEVARELKSQGINVGVLHPNVLRPFPKKEWAEVLKGKKVFVLDRDDPYGASAGRLSTELAWVVNEYGLAEGGTQLFSGIYGLGGRTPSLSLVKDEMHKALRHVRGEIEMSPEKRYIGVKV